MERLGADLRADGWFALDVAAHEIQRNTPFLLANRLIGAALDGLGADADRYTGGIEEGLAALDRSFARRFGIDAPTTLDSNRYRDVFTRFFEGVGADRKIAILCDDAQWIDAQSAETLDRFTAGYLGPLAIVFAERVAPDDGKTQAEGTIALDPLPPSDALALVRAHFASLSDVLAQTVVDHAGGNPFELLTLAEEATHGESGDDAAERSARDLIAVRVRRLPREDREFLQFCALLGDPIEYRVLFARDPDPERIARLVGNVGRPYFVADGPALRFRHARIADAVRSTVALDVALRRQIIEVLQGLKERDLTDYERIAVQALALDDKALAFDSYVAAAELAMSRRSGDAAVAAFERALAIGEPTREKLVQFTLGYTWALRSVNRDPEAVELLQRTLNEFRDEPSVNGLGSLAAQLVFVSWALERIDVCNSTLDTWVPLLSGARERATALVAGVCVAATELDYPRMCELLDHLAPQGNLAEIQPLMHTAKALEASGRGDYTSANQSMESALTLVDRAPNGSGDLLPFTRVLIDFRHVGARRAAAQLPEILRRTRLGNRNLFSGIFFLACSRIASGDWEAATELVAEAAEIHEATAVAAPLFALPAMMRTLSGEPTRWEAEVQAMASAALREGCEEAFRQIAPWAAMAGNKPVALLDGAVASVLEAPLPTLRCIALGYAPFGYALWCSARGRRDLLERVAHAPDGRDASPWARAHEELMRGVAQKLLGLGGASSALEAARALFAGLDATFYAAYASQAASTLDERGRELLGALGVGGVGAEAITLRARVGTPSRLTRREREVASLVSEGMTNRQVATRLFLSERTVEVHLGSVYAKLGVDSRSMLVRYLWSRGNPDIVLLAT